MTADMHITQLVVENVNTLAEEVVHRAVEQFLVAGDRHGTENDSIPLAQSDLAMIAQTHAYHGAGRFTLAAGGNYDDLTTRQAFHLGSGEQFFLGNVEIAKLDGDLDIADHRAAHDTDAA